MPEPQGPAAAACWNRVETSAVLFTLRGWDTLPFLSFPVADQGSHGFYEIAEQAGTVKAGDVRDLFKVTPWACGRDQALPLCCCAHWPLRK